MGGNEPIKLNFGKKIGDVVLKNDDGIQKGAFKNDSTAEFIFSHYNNGVDGILDSSGLELFYTDIETAAGKDKKLSESEARDFLKSIGMKDVKKSEARGMIKAFLDKINGKDDQVVSAVRDKDNYVTVTYKDGKVEIYLYDAKSNKSLLQEQKFTDEDGEHDIFYLADGKTKGYERIEKGDDLTKIYYENDTVKKSNELKPYKEGDNFSLKSEMVPEGTAYVQTEKDSKDKITKLTFLDDTKAKIATQEYSADGKTIVQKDKHGKETRYETGENGQTKQTVTDRNGVKTVTEDDKVVTQFSETRTMTKEGDNVVLKDGENKVTLKYDKEGNLIAYAKEGESFKATAKRLGIDVNNEQEYKEFCELNKDAVKRSHGGWFKIGEEVKLPTGFEAKLDIEKYDVDNKTEQASYRSNVGNSSAEKVTVKKTKPETHKVVEDNLPDFVKKSNKIPPENKAYFDSLPKNKKDGKDNVKFNSIQFTKSGDPYIKIETEKGNMTFTYKEGDSLELNELNVKANGAQNSTGFHKLDDIKTLVPEWILEEAHKIANTALTTPEVVVTDSKVDSPKNPLADLKIPERITFPPARKEDRPAVNINIDTKRYPDRAKQKKVLSDGSSIEYDQYGYIKTIRNPKGQPTKKVARRDDNSIAYLYNYIYNDDGTLKQEVKYKPVALGFARYEYSDYYYDNGKLKSEVHRSAPSGSHTNLGSKFGTVEWVENSIYDKQGNLLAKAYYDERGKIYYLEDANEEKIDFK